MSCLLIEFRIMYRSFLYSHTSSPTVTNLKNELLLVWTSQYLEMYKFVTLIILFPQNLCWNNQKMLLQVFFLSPCRSHLLFTAVALKLDICCEGFKSSSPRWIMGVSLFYLSTFVLVIANIKYKVCKWQMFQLGGTQWRCHSI